MNKWFFEFQYDDRGRGELILREGNVTVLSYPETRTGTIDSTRALKRAILPGIWSLQDKSVATTEYGMVVEPDKEARKIRLYSPFGKWTSFLIHADGGRPGSLGCVVTHPRHGNNEGLFQFADNILKKQSTIPVYINTPVPREVYDGEIV